MAQFGLEMSPEWPSEAMLRFWTESGRTGSGLNQLSELTWLLMSAVTSLKWIGSGSGYNHSTRLNPDPQPAMNSLKNPNGFKMGWLIWIRPTQLGFGPKPSKPPVGF